ncbi:MAG TPA: type IV pilus assembly protein PilM [Gaiellaceae bacterium]|nr:type IV pilus assembly protein PilM [Gaiellaceae bacterium]
MDDLPHGTDEEPSEAHEYESEPEIDAVVLDPLAAYTRGIEPVRPEGDDHAVAEAQDQIVETHQDPAVEEVPVQTVAEDRDHAVEEDHSIGVEDHPAAEDHALEAVLEAEVEPDMPEAGTMAPGPSRQERRRRLAGRRQSDAPPEKKTKKTKSSKDKREKKLVGLKIGASQIAAAHIVNNGAPELVEVFRQPLEPGLVVSGEIRDPDALGEALKRFFERHKLPKRGVRLGLANNRIGVRVFEIEGVADPQQLENAIRFRAEEVLPIPLDQAVLDYVVLGDEAREDGTPVKRILLVVAYREVVDRYLQACRRAGLQVVGIDLEAFALLRSLEAPADRGQGAGALVAVAMGHDRTTIAVSTGRLCEFTRVLDWGGWSLNVAIARELDRAPSEVEAIKRQLSFARATEVEGLAPEQAAKAREAVQRALAAFTRELVASLHFYQAQPGAFGIGEIVLTGGTAHMDGLPDAISQLVGVPVRLGDPFRRVKVGPKITHEDQHGSLAVAIGLGIED